MNVMGLYLSAVWLTSDEEKSAQAETNKYVDCDEKGKWVSKTGP